MSRESFIISIFGKRGFGKTTWAKSYIIKNLKAYNKIYIFDLASQFRDLLGLPQVEFINFYDIDELVIHRGSLYVFDEIDLLMTQHSNQSLFNLYFLFNESRIYNIDIIITARRPHRVSRDITALSNRVIVFRITENRDIQYLEDLLELDKEKINKIKNLPKFKYLEFKI